MDRATFATELREGSPLVGGWSTTADPVLLEVLAAEGFDFVVVDGEHSENTIADLAAGVRAIDAAGGDTRSIVRVRGADRAEIRRVLDFGPSGVLIPQIESLEEARDAVAATAYPPEGVRGVAGGRSSNYGADLADAVATDDERVATILQVETEGALDAVADIAAIDGLDALFIGPADLSARLGVFGAFETATFREAVERIVAAAHDVGVPVGTLATGPEQVQTRWQDWDVDFLVAGTDLRYVRDGVAGYLDVVEDVRAD